LLKGHIVRESCRGLINNITMSRQCNENQVISELYGKAVIKEEGEVSPRLSQPHAAAPMGSLEARDVTVRLLGSQLMIETHYGSLVVPLAADQVQAVKEDWADLAKQDKSA
jgi:hypothetical protein